MFKKGIAFILSVFMLTEPFAYAVSNPTTTQVQTDFSNITNQITSTINQNFDSDSIANFEKDTKLRNPLKNIFRTTQWSLFLKEFEMTMKIGVCCPDDNILNCAIGFKAHMAEPIGYFETSQSPFYFPTIGLNIGTSTMERMIKSNSLMTLDHKDESSPRSISAYAHFLYFPIFGLIFKKKLKFVCFHQGDLLIPYMSEFDPTWRMDIYYSQMLPHIIMMLTPSTIISGIFDCMASETVNAIHSYSSGFTDISLTSGNMKILEGYSPNDVYQRSKKSNPEKLSFVQKLNAIRDTMYFIDGCNGYAPIGGYVTGDDAIADAGLTWYGIMTMLHGASALSPIPFLEKQTDMVFNFENFGPGSEEIPKGLPDTSCAPEKFPLPIASQYLLQLAYPTVGTAKELGVPPFEQSTAKNVPGSQNSAVFVVWERRDYYAFAYQCPSELGDKKDTPGR